MSGSLLVQAANPRPEPHAVRVAVHGHRQVVAELGERRGLVGTFPGLREVETGQERPCQNFRV